MTMPRISKAQAAAFAECISTREVIAFCKMYADEYIAFLRQEASQGYADARTELVKIVPRGECMTMSSCEVGDKTQTL